MTARLPPEEKARRAALRKAKSEATREERAAKVRANQKAYYDANAERMRAKAKAYRDAHKAELKAAREARHAADPSKRHERDRRYYRTRIAPNRVEENAKARAWRAARIDVVREQNRLNMARRRERLGKMPRSKGLTRTAWKETLDLFGSRCAYCLAPAQEADHLEPLVRGGSDTPANIVPACRFCNRSKGPRTLLQWMLLKAQR